MSNSHGYHASRSPHTSESSRVRTRSIVFLLITLLIVAFSAHAGWVPVGPFGGDVRALVSDPAHPDRMYLGTRIGQIYVSQNGGKSWNQLRGFNPPNAWVVDSLIVDPSDSAVIYAGLWSLGAATGGIFKTTDGGLTWKELEGIRGQSVRALAMAPSSSKILVAGSLEGVFRTDDGGVSWRRISPPRHEEIRNVESIAIDPVHPSTIYAGTWHLPWRTIDGGQHWVSIKKGIIDDSDVFSIIVDRAHPQTLYLSACTGIYRSDSMGEEWKKTQGIPYSSRRTRVLMMERGNSETVYAGTTEGLWRTRDGGANWTRLTHHTWVINAVVLDPLDPNHVLLGMDQSGVMESRDSGQVFQSANGGFAQRQISSIVADPTKPDRFFASLVEDGQIGSVLVTEDNGANWRPAAPGLEGHDVLSLLVVAQPAWRLLAGTSDGIFELAADQKAWQNLSQIRSPTPSLLPGKLQGPSTSQKADKSRVNLASKAASLTDPPDPPGGVAVWSLYRRDEREAVYAASSAGLLESRDGRTWTPLPLSVSGAGITSIATGGQGGRIILVVAATGIRISRDAGRSWNEIRVDSDPLFRAQKAASSRSGVLFVGGTTGLYRSTDSGLSWEKFGHGLPYSSIRDILVAQNDPNRILVASMSGIFESSDGGEHYNRIGENPAMEALSIERLALHPSSGRPAFAASAYNGLFFYEPSERGASEPIPDGVRATADTRSR